MSARDVVDRTVEHLLVVLSPPTKDQFATLLRLCGLPPERFKPWVNNRESDDNGRYRFQVPASALGPVTAFARDARLEFRVETTVATTHRPGLAPAGDDEEVFRLDDGRLRAWLAAKRDALELDAAAEAVTFGDLGDEGIHHDLERYVYELGEEGILVEPPGWDIGVYALDDDDQWGYLVTVRTSNDRRRPGGLAFFQVADTADDVRSSTPVAREVGYVVQTANRLLPVARAAWTATDPTAAYHPEGMGKAAGHHERGDDECSPKHPSSASVDRSDETPLIRIVFTVDDVASMAAAADVPPEVALERAREWADAIEDTAITLCNQQLASVVANDSP